jgi:hypothetical protein
MPEDARVQPEQGDAVWRHLLNGMTWSGGKDDGAVSGDSDESGDDDREEPSFPSMAITL